MYHFFDFSYYCCDVSLHPIHLFNITYTREKNRDNCCPVDLIYYYNNSCLISYGGEIFMTICTVVYVGLMIYCLIIGILFAMYSIYKKYRLRNIILLLMFILCIIMVILDIIYLTFHIINWCKLIHTSRKEWDWLCSLFCFKILLFIFHPGTVFVLHCYLLSSFSDACFTEKPVMSFGFIWILLLSSVLNTDQFVFTSINYHA